ncbi:ABC transporter ATP-binding protein [Faecalibaculum rodentium]|uniref:ABC transporter ATP-binding protein n=1 Tax=Faecalibaculum rodentium TaxID=1702221 RepID=UPI0026F3E795|nr:ABC transporter ATP-binding protein [Faecalibaculum rodentium]
MADTQPILKIRDLDISFKTDGGNVKAVRGVDLDLHKGETIAIVGESGSGKSVTTKAVMGILAGNGTINNGTIEYTYADMSPERIAEVQEKYDGVIPEGYLKPEEIKTVDIVQSAPKFIQSQIRGRRIAMVFQDPMTSLDPTMTIGKQVMEAMRFHYNTPKQEAWKKAVRLLELVGITDAEKRMKNYPHQLSGGMRQRVVIAIALSCDPEVLICDEPTTALDVTIQAKILELIKEIQKKKDLSVIYITHDLGVVAKVADYVNVMYAGRIIETGTVNAIFYDPRHPYTWGLLASMPDVDSSDDELYTIPGTPPNMLHEPVGDAFAPRNRFALQIDEKVAPPMFELTPTHKVASWLPAPNAPKVEMPEDLKKRINRMKKEADLNV